MGSKHIILDLDGTLICGDGISVVLKPRPYLSEFLDYVFRKFDTVSIWTAATPEWFNHVYMTVLSRLLPPGRGFRFVWTRNKCRETKIRKMVGHNLLEYLTYIKPLEEVYGVYLDMNCSNTYIVDDTPDTYKLNFMNAIPILSYTGSISDLGLVQVIRNIEQGYYV